MNPYVIHKYRLKLEDYPLVEMPIGAEVLHVGMQYGHLHVWARVDPTLEKKTRHFAVRGTGHANCPAANKHIGTVVDGSFIWHVFDLEVTT